MKVLATPPDIQRLRLRYREGGRARALERVAGPLPAGRYLHWEHLRYRGPPADLTHEEWWLGTKLAREQLYQPLPLQDARGREFVLSRVPPIEEALIRVDEIGRGLGPLEAQGLLPHPPRCAALREEAIHSAQMAGAALNRRDARAMLDEERAPRDRSERLITDAYHALRLVEDLSGEPLTPELITEVHQAMTAGTLELGAAGRLRQPHEEPRVTTLRGEALFTPPPAHQLQARVGELCAFANGETPDWPLHPVLRGLAVHLWVSYEHPFVSGNGRVARALFQWAMLSEGYPLLAYLPLSRVLRREKSAYERACLYTVSDDGDATYFLLFLLETLLGVLEELPRSAPAEEPARPEAPPPPVIEPEDAPTDLGAPPRTHTPPPATDRPPITLLEHAMKAGGELNERQLSLVHHGLRHKGHVWTIQAHREAHGVAYETARHDLQDLHLRGFFTRRRKGRAWEFLPAPDLADRLMA